MSIPQPYDTGLTEEQLAEAFRRALGDMTDEDIEKAISTAISLIPKGLVYRGAYNYFSELPTNAKESEVYTVKYKGTSGTEPDGNEYAWGEYEGTLQWIPLGVDSYTKKEIDEMYDEISYNVESNKSDILKARVGTGLIEVKNLFNKDGEINSTYSGSVVSSTSADFNTVNGNVITFNRNSSTSQPTGQFLRNLKNKKIIVSFNVVSFGTGTTVAFRAFERGNGTPIVNEYPNKIGAFKYAIDIDKEEVLFGFATSGGRGAQIENLMIRYAEITDDTYAPFTGIDLQGQIYALTDRIKTLEAALAQTTTVSE